MPTAFNNRLVCAMRTHDIEDIDQAAMFLRMSGHDYEAIRARFNVARNEAGMTELNAAEHDHLMLRCDELGA